MPRKTNCFRKNLEKVPPCGIRHKSYLWPALLLSPSFTPGFFLKPQAEEAPFPGTPSSA